MTNIFLNNKEMFKVAKANCNERQIIKFCKLKTRTTMFYEYILYICIYFIHEYE